MRHALGRVRDQMIRQLLGDLGREKAGVRIGDLVYLFVHRLCDVGMAVTEARNSGAAGGVQVSLAGGVFDPGAMTGDGQRKLGSQLTMQNAAHSKSPRR